MRYESINFTNKLSMFQDLWSPKVIAEMNDYQLKLVKIKDEFVWHRHVDTDEVFIVLNGEMAIAFEDGRVSIGTGEMFVVPRGVQHKPEAERECCVLIIEPRGVVNTGDADGDLTARNDVWI